MNEIPAENVFSELEATAAAVENLWNRATNDKKLRTTALAHRASHTNAAKKERRCDYVNLADKKQIS